MIEIGTSKGMNDRKAWILARHSSGNFGKHYSTLHFQPDVGEKEKYRGVAIGYNAGMHVPYHTHLAVNGKVGIGTISPSHDLHVAGDTRIDGILYTDNTIKAKEVKVQQDVWEDRVFKQDYKLRTLAEVETFVSKNSHLPDIPSEEEVKQEGLNLGDMDAKLLHKIEELTLYVIEQDKNTQALQEQNKQLIQEIENLKQEISALKNE